MDNLIQIENSLFKNYSWPSIYNSVTSDFYHITFSYFTYAYVWVPFIDLILIKPVLFISPGPIV